MLDWKTLTTREKICQTVCALAKPEKEIARFGSINALLDQYPIGGFFVGGEVIKDASVGNQEIAQAVTEYNRHTRVPLIFASDMENGCGSMVPGLTPFPFLMALGATRSDDLAYAYGKATALESRSIGVNWTFSPVSDLNKNRLNPVTNIRALGDDPELAKRLLPQIIRGMQDYGLAACAKHFPGDGMDYRDQHLVTTQNSLSMDAWRYNHGGVFQRTIDAGVYSIMAGHITLPAYQKERRNDRCLPATLSHELLTDLLKGEMGFQGVIVSDALIMGGFLGWYDRPQSEIECFKAGVDMMLWPTWEYVERLEQAIESGEVSIERLDDAVSRIWQMKQKLGLLDRTYVSHRTLDATDTTYVADTAQNVAETSLTLLRDRNQLLPLDTSVRRALVVAITPHDATYQELDVLKTALEQRGVEVTLQRNIWYKQLEEQADQFDLILYVVHRAPHRPMGTLNFWNNEAGSIWSALSSGKSKSVVVSLASPYFYNEYFEAADTYINAYSAVPVTLQALVRALYGEIPFVGSSPVLL